MRAALRRTPDGRMLSATHHRVLLVEDPAMPVAAVDQVFAELGRPLVRWPALDAAANTAPLPAARLHAVRVLVVDDNRDAADTLAALLELLGHVAQVAHDGHAALAAMQEFRPQVVILDIGMPGMNGYQVAEAIRDDRRFDQPLLVALTGRGGEQDRQRTDAAGFDQRLTKPVDLGVIERMLGALQRRYQCSASSRCAMRGQHSAASCARSAHR